MKFYSYRAVTLFLLLVGLTSGCGGSGNFVDQNGNGEGTTLSTTQTQNQQGALQLTLQASRSTYQRGQSIPLTLTAKNTGSQTVNGTVSCIPYDLQITQGTTIIFDSNSSGVQPACAGILALSPGKSQSYDLSWNQTKSDGKPIPSGTYTLTVYLEATGVGSSGPIAPPPITVTVS